MKDNYKKIRGHITIECIDRNGAVIDKFEKKNLIMDTARNAMAGIVAGIDTASPINKFVLGTEGHLTGDFLTPKGEIDGFVSSRTRLFSEDLSAYHYAITFDTPGVPSGECTIISEEGSGSTIFLDVVNSDVQYTITIPEANANNGGIAVFTEAALYAGGNIFSMKCFPAKVKDDTVSLRVIWKILL